jgi:hypothetical protein
VLGFTCNEGHQDRISIRDYFAGQALTGLLANPEIINDISFLKRTAYRYADAMMEEREKTND